MKAVRWMAAALAVALSPMAAAEPGYVYDSPYAAPYYYAPYPYYYPWGGPRSVYGPSEGDFGGDAVIPAGRLVLLVDPVTADVFVDGRKLNPRNDLTYQVGLLVGPHEVEVKADGFRAYKNTVDLQAGRRMVLTVRLNR